MKNVYRKRSIVSSRDHSESGAVLLISAISFGVIFLLLFTVVQFLKSVEDAIKNINEVSQTVVQMTRNIPNQQEAYEAGIWVALVNQRGSVSYNENEFTTPSLTVNIDSQPNVTLEYITGQPPKVYATSQYTTDFLTGEYLNTLQSFNTKAEIGGEASEGLILFAFDNSLSMKGAPEDLTAPSIEVTTPIENLLMAANLPVATRGEASSFCYPISMDKLQGPGYMNRSLTTNEQIALCWRLWNQLPYAIAGRALPMGLYHWDSRRSDDTDFQDQTPLSPGSYTAGCLCERNGQCPEQKGSTGLHIHPYNPAIDLAGTGYSTPGAYCDLLWDDSLVRVCGTAYPAALEFSSLSHFPGQRVDLFDLTTCPTNRVPVNQASGQSLCQPLTVGGQTIRITDGDICRNAPNFNSTFLTPEEETDLSNLGSVIGSGNSGSGEIPLSGGPLPQRRALELWMSDFHIAAKQIVQGAVMGLSERFQHLNFYVFSAAHRFGSFAELAPPVPPAVTGAPIRGVVTFHDWTAGNIYQHQMSIWPFLQMPVQPASGGVVNLQKNIHINYVPAHWTEMLLYLDHDTYPNLNPAPGTDPIIGTTTDWGYSKDHAYHLQSYIRPIDNPNKPWPSPGGALTQELSQPGFHFADSPFFSLSRPGQMDLFVGPGQYQIFASVKQNPIDTVTSTGTYIADPTWNILGNNNLPAYTMPVLTEIDPLTGAQQTGNALSIPSGINNPLGLFNYIQPSAGGTRTDQQMAQFADDCEIFRTAKNNPYAFCTAILVTDGIPEAPASQDGFDFLAAGGGTQLTAAPLLFGDISSPGTLMYNLNQNLLRFENDGNTFVFNIFISHQTTLSADTTSYLSLFNPTSSATINPNPDGRATYTVDYTDTANFKENLKEVLQLVILLASNRASFVGR